MVSILQEILSISRKALAAVPATNDSNESSTFTRTGTVFTVIGTATDDRN